MLWLRGWLQQASSEGPRCADGSLFKEIRLSKQDCQRERMIEPMHPGCELEALGMATSPPYLSHNTDAPPPRQDDYAYDEYDDYPQESNSSDLNSLVATTTLPLDTGTKSFGYNGSQTTVTKKNPGIPPSPSTSGFTFFGVPLPSLSFSLWGKLFYENYYFT